ncbi:MAG TPA: DUF748 domain-containing protein [Marinagarivorans sp.]
MVNATAARVSSALKKRRKVIFWCLALLLIYGLCLGVLLPWVIKSQAQKIAAERLDLSLTIERLRINPFLFTFEIKNLALNDKREIPVIGFERFSLDFETSSLFRWAWTLDHIALTGLHANVERFSETDDTLTRLQTKWLETQPPSHETETLEPAIDDPDQQPTRFLVRHITLQVANIAITDKVPATPFETALGPVALEVNELTTLPERIGVHDIIVRGDQGIELSWRGDIELTPFGSRGHMTVKGPFPVIASRYMQDRLPVSVDEGAVSVAFDYQLALDEVLAVALDNINVTVDELKVTDRATAQPLYSLAQLSVSNARFVWPEQLVVVPKIALDGGELWLQRDSEGLTNIEKIMARFDADGSSAAATPNSTKSKVSGGQVPKTSKPASASMPSSANAADSSPAWTVTNALFELNDWTIRWDDQSLPRPANYEITDIGLAVRDYRFKDGAAVTFDYGLALLDGTVTGKGTVVPMPFGQLDVTTAIERITLSALQPYIEPVAKVALTTGQFDGTATVASADDGFVVDSDFSVSQLRVVENATDKDILRWQALSFQALSTSTQAKELLINRIVLDQPFADFAIEDDGTTTIDRVLVASAEQEPSASEPAPVDNTQETLEEAPFVFKIGSIQVNEGGGLFSDASLPLPFATKIHNLNGGVSTIDSQSQATADVQMEGQLDEYGLLKVDGTLNPFAFDQQSDLKLLFKNVNVPNFTPYSVKFAGRKITNGRLDLNLQYAFDQGKMQGKNDLVLKSFDLGESVDHPGAMDLPLDLAVALLKDGDGKITLNMPVAGDVNSPEFSVGDIVGQALVKILKSAVTSPFRLLAGLVGGNADDFGKVEFSAGRSDITPPEKEKLDSLAKAMLERPALALKVAGIYDPALDLQMLQNMAFEQQAKAAFGEKFASLSLASEDYIDYLEDGYKDAALSPPLKVLKAQFMADGDKDTFDNLAYAKALKQRLVERVTIADDALLQLANARANNVQTELLSQGINAEQVSVLAPVNIKAKSTQHLVMALEVSVVR